MLSKNPGDLIPYDALETWERLGPLSLDRIAEKATRPVLFDLKDSEYREVAYPDGSRVCGQFNRQTGNRDGIIRCISQDRHIYEG